MTSILRCALHAVVLDVALPRVALHPKIRAANPLLYEVQHVRFGGNDDNIVLVEAIVVAQTNLNDVPERGAGRVHHREEALPRDGLELEGAASGIEAPRNERAAGVLPHEGRHGAAREVGVNLALDRARRGERHVEPLVKALAQLLERGGGGAIERLAHVLLDPLRCREVVPEAVHVGLLRGELHIVLRQLAAEHREERARGRGVGVVAAGVVEVVARGVNGDALALRRSTGLLLALALVPAARAEEQVGGRGVNLAVPQTEGEVVPLLARHKPLRLDPLAVPARAVLEQGHGVVVISDVGMRDGEGTLAHHLRHLRGTEVAQVVVGGRGARVVAAHRDARLLRSGAAGVGHELGRHRGPRGGVSGRAYPRHAQRGRRGGEDGVLHAEASW